MIGPSLGDAFLALRPTNPDGDDRPRGFSDAELAVLTAGRAALDAALAGLRSHRIGTDAPVRVDLSALPDADARLVDEVLGEGEVQVKLADGTRVQESVMPGLWRVKTAAASWLEVADIPAVVREAVRPLPAVVVVPAEDRIPRGAMNVRAVLGELRDAAAARADDPRAGGGWHEVNLTLLPMTPVDLMVLETQLGGDGPVDILSRGYGNCRIVSTGIRNVWRLMYFNADDKMILHVLQVGDVPAAGLAAQDDLADSAERLHDILGAYYP